MTKGTGDLCFNVPGFLRLHHNAVGIATHNRVALAMIGESIAAWLNAENKPEIHVPSTKLAYIP